MFNVRFSITVGLAKMVNAGICVSKNREQLRFFPSLLLVPITQLKHNYTDQSSWFLLSKVLIQTAIIEAIKFSSRTSVFYRLSNLTLVVLFRL